MQALDLGHYLCLAQNVAQHAGALIEERKGAGYRVVRKELREMVTEIDVAVQSLIVEELKARTGDEVFLTEEVRGTHAQKPEGWIIDPLDGTHNFIAGLPFYCVSVGYLQSGVIELGVVYFPQTKDMYYARKGQGAFCNQKRISVSLNKDIAKSMVAYDNQFYLNEKSLKNFIRLQEAVFTTRILGVAGRDACFVAEGVLDARIWNATKLCDIAVGSLLVEEAGGRVTDFQGNPLNLAAVKDVIVSNGKVHEALIQLFRKRGKE